MGNQLPCWTPKGLGPKSGPSAFKIEVWYASTALKVRGPCRCVCKRAGVGARERDRVLEVGNQPHWWLVASTELWGFLRGYHLFRL